MTNNEKSSKKNLWNNEYTEEQEDHLKKAP
jgi:hypothetical protein